MLLFYEEFKGKREPCYDLYVKTAINNLINSKARKINKNLLASRTAREREAIKLNLPSKRKFHVTNKTKK
jgi:hypothetical protein